MSTESHAVAAAPVRACVVFASRVSPGGSALSNSCFASAHSFSASFRCGELGAARSALAQAPFAFRPSRKRSACVAVVAIGSSIPRAWSAASRSAATDSRWKATCEAFGTDEPVKLRAALNAWTWEIVA